MKKRLYNKGYSIVELLVVISIMAVGLTIASLSIATIASNNARQVATNIDTMISRGKSFAVYRAPVVYIEIDIDAAGRNYIGRYYEGDPAAPGGLPGLPIDANDYEILGPVSVNLEWNGFTASDLPVRIAFTRGTGVMSEVTSSTPGGAADTPVPFAAGTFPQFVVGGAAGTYFVNMTPLTGAHSVTR